MKEIVLKNMNITTDSGASDILEFEFEPITTCDIYDGFELGNLSINGYLASISSSDLLGRGAMMIFTSAVCLLDGVRIFLQDTKRQSYEWVGDDSSFILKIERCDKHSVKIMVGKLQFGRYSNQAFAVSVKDGVSRLMKDYGHALTKNSAVLDDLSAALIEFDSFFVHNIISV